MIEKFKTFYFNIKFYSSSPILSSKLLSFHLNQMKLNCFVSIKSTKVSLFRALNNIYMIQFAFYLFIINVVASINQFYHHLFISISTFKRFACFREWQFTTTLQLLFVYFFNFMCDKSVSSSKVVILYCRWVLVQENLGFCLF